MTVDTHFPFRMRSRSLSRLIAAPFLVFVVCLFVLLYTPLLSVSLGGRLSTIPVLISPSPATAFKCPPPRSYPSARYFDLANLENYEFLDPKKNGYIMGNLPSILDLPTRKGAALACVDGPSESVIKEALRGAEIESLTNPSILLAASSDGIFFLETPGKIALGLVSDAKYFGTALVKITNNQCTFPPSGNEGDSRGDR